MAGKVKILLHNLRLEILLGIHAEEKTQPQPVLICAEVELKAQPITGNLGDTLCYEQLAKKIELITQNHFLLAEDLARRIAEDCLLDKKVYSARVAVKKLKAIDKADYAGVEIFLLAG